MINHNPQTEENISIVIKPIQVMTIRYSIVYNGVCITTSERRDIAEGLAMFLEGEKHVPHRPTE